MTDAEIAALKAAATVATRGKWVAGHESDRGTAPPEVSIHIPCSDVGSWWIATVFDGAKGVSAANNAAYIALANPDAILSLIARLEAAEARAERLAAVLEAEREERRAERAVREAGDALARAEARDDEWAYAHAVKQHDAALRADDVARQRADAARAAIAKAKEGCAMPATKAQAAPNIAYRVDDRRRFVRVEEARP